MTFAQRLLEDSAGSVSIVTWVRSSQDEIFLGSNPDNVLRLKAAYGRGWKNTFGHLKFFTFVIKRLYALKPQIVYACDLDTLIPSLIWRANKRAVVIFDQFDPFSSRTNNHLLQQVVDKFECFIAKKSDIRIVANKSRIPQHMSDAWHEIKNIHPINIPLRTNSNNVGPRVLFYGGILSMDRGLIACAEAISHEPQWEFHLYGQGEISSLLAARKYRNVFVHKPVPHKFLIELASGANLYLATYDPARRQNRSTASNKLFEAAQLGIPLLTSKGTDIGDETATFNLGWSVIYNSISDIRTVLREYSEQISTSSEIYKKNLNSFYESNIEKSELETRKIKSRLRYLLGE